MTRTRSFALNVAATVFMQIAVVISGFIIPRTMLVYYGSEVNGLVSSLTQFMGYFSLVEMGLSGATVYALYKPLAQNNYNLVSSIVTTAKHFYYVSGYIFVGLTVGLAFLYPAFVKTSALSGYEMFLLVFILGFSGALDFFSLAKYRALLTADQKTYVISIATVIFVVANTIIIILMSTAGFNIVLVRGVALFSVLLRSCVLSFYVQRKYKYINYNASPCKSALNKRWDALFIEIAVSVQNGAPIILATIFADLKVVSICSIYMMILGGLGSLARVLQSGLTASFGDVIAKNENSTLKKAYDEFEFLFYSIITVLFSVCFLLIMPFIKIYTRGITDVNYYLPVVGFLFVLNGVLNLLKAPQGMLVISAGMYRETRYQTLIQTLLIIIIGIILIGKYGLVGILVGMLVSNIYRDIDLLFFVPKYITKSSYKSTLKRWGLMILYYFVICIPFHWIVIKAENYFVWAVYGAGIFIYAALILLLGSYLFEKEYLDAVVARVKLVVLR